MSAVLSWGQELRSETSAVRRTASVSQKDVTLNIIMRLSWTLCVVIIMLINVAPACYGSPEYLHGRGAMDVSLAGLGSRCWTKTNQTDCERKVISDLWVSMMSLEFSRFLCPSCLSPQDPAVPLATWPPPPPPSSWPKPWTPLPWRPLPWPPTDFPLWCSEWQIYKTSLGLKSLSVGL